MTMLAITSEVIYKEVYRRIYTAMANWHYLRALPIFTCQFCIIMLIIAYLM